MSSPCSPLWLITGGCSGLGRAIAVEALARGHRVIVTSRREVPDTPPGAVCRRLDLADPASRRAFLAALAESGETPDFLVNNAGEAVLAPLETTAPEDFHRQMELHFHGPLALITTVLPAMRARASGVIVNISAAAAVSNYPGFAAYGASKAALDAASDALRREVEPHGVKVVVVHPGPFRTGFAKRCLESRPGVSAECERTVGRFARQLTSLDGRQPGDPARAAAVLVDAALAEKPPAQLSLGRYMAGKYDLRAGELSAAARAGERFAVDYPPGA